jgi:2-polyprenyl-6-hydroxyphenyl methylase/3-demethylubiquinone-9 3-methyltransferase
LIRPSELKQWAQQNGLEFRRLSSLIYNPLTRKFKVVAEKEDNNYFAHFIKPN